MSREQQIHSPAPYDTRRGGLFRPLQAHPERKKGISYYELNLAEGDPFGAASESLRHFVGGEWIPNANNYKMALRRRWVGIAAQNGYRAFVDFKEGRITEGEYEEAKAKTLHTVENNAKIRNLRKKITTRSRQGSVSIRVSGDLLGTIQLSELLERLGKPFGQQEQEQEKPGPTPSFGEEDYSYVGHQSLSGRPEDSDANRLFNGYVTAAKNALKTDHQDPELDHAKAMLAATHRLNNDLVKYKRTRRGMKFIDVLANSGKDR